MCMGLSAAWLRSGAFTHAPVATHVSPSKPGVTRFYARHLSFDPAPQSKHLAFMMAEVPTLRVGAVEALQAFAFPPSLTPISAHAPRARSNRNYGGGNLHAAIRVRSRRSPPEALRRRKLRRCGCVPPCPWGRGSRVGFKGNVMCVEACDAGLWWRHMRRGERRGSKGRSPWNAGVQGVFVTTPPARRRHNEIGRGQQG